MRCGPRHSWHGIVAEYWTLQCWHRQQARLKNVLYMQCCKMLQEGMNYAVD
jgi:hypothetical protein